MPAGNLHYGLSSSHDRPPAEIEAIELQKQSDAIWGLMWLFPDNIHIKRLVHGHLIGVE